MRSGFCASRSHLRMLTPPYLKGIDFRCHSSSCVAARIPFFEYCLLFCSRWIVVLLSLAGSMRVDGVIGHHTNGVIYHS